MGTLLLKLMYCLRLISVNNYFFTKISTFQILKFPNSSNQTSTIIIQQSLSLQLRVALIHHAFPLSHRYLIFTHHSTINFNFSKFKISKFSIDNQQSNINNHSPSSLICGKNKTSWILA